MAGAVCAPVFSPCCVCKELDGSEFCCWGCMCMWHVECQVLFKASLASGDRRGSLRHAQDLAAWPPVLRDVYEHLCTACKVLLTHGGVVRKTVANATVGS